MVSRDLPYINIFKQVIIFRLGNKDDIAAVVAGNDDRFMVLYHIIAGFIKIFDNAAGCCC